MPLALWLLPPLALGAVLRLWGLTRQVLVGDEIHAVVSVVNFSVREILTTYRFADHCIPLAAFYRALTAGGIRLSEEIVRAPAVLAGLAALLLFPLAVARRPELEGGRRRAAILAWLLAVSPSLVYYSRIARPYAVVVLLAPLAVAAFWRWWRGGGHRWAVLYALAGAVSGWFFLGSAPFVAAPLAWGAGDLAVRRLGGRFGGRREAGGRGWLALGAVAAGLAAGAAAFLLPALPSFLRLVRRKAAAASAGAGDLGAAAQLQAGTGQPVLAVLFWGLAALGLFALLRRRPALGSFALLPVLVQWVALLLVVRPAGLNSPVAIHRYTLVCLPVVLLWVAEGIVWLGARLGGRGKAAAWASGAVATGCIGAMILGGPFVRELGLRLGPFAGASLMVSSAGSSEPLPPGAAPAAYRLIAAEPGDEPVVEVLTGRTAISALRQTIALARFHGRPVILASDRPLWSDPRLAFRTVVPANPEAIERSGGRFVVLLLDGPRIRRLERAIAEGLPPPGPTPRDHESVVRARELGRVLRRAWGEPHLSSDDVAVWDLAQVARGGPGERGAAAR